MLDNAKLAIALAVARRVAVPIVIGATVGWLAAHGYNNWAAAVCSVSDAMGIIVEECK